MPAFGVGVTDRVWRVLRSQRALTTVTFTAVGEPVIDPTTGDVTRITTTETPEALLTRYGQQEVDGVRITARDRKLLIPQSELTVDPEVVSTVTIAGAVWDVIDVQEVNNSGAWELQVRQVGEV